MSTYQPKIEIVPYGLHIPYNQGYDARSRANTPPAEQMGANGYLRRDSDQAQVALLVTDLTANFGVSGEVGQSQILREFFPRSFNDVTLTITGNVASTYEYNRLAAFVREAHWNALNLVRQNVASPATVTFQLSNRTPGAWSGARQVKGPHKSWQVSGYIQSMAGGAVTQEVAPAFTIGMVVTDSELQPSQNLWAESTAPVPVLSDILSLIAVDKVSDRASGRGFVTNQGPGAVQDVQQGVRSAVNDVKQAIWSVESALKTLGIPTLGIG